jgi:hypothetical protein
LRRPRIIQALRAIGIEMLLNRQRRRRKSRASPEAKLQ